jgi:dipeptidyl aminopeptidase/acylaminoacyl peptidase
MAQSIEWCHALETMRVTTQMVVYPNEEHVFHRPADDRDYTLRMLQWIDQWFAKGTDYAG